MGSRPQSLFKWVSKLLLHNGFVHEAMELFNGMIQRTVVSWNSIILGFTHNEHSKEGLRSEDVENFMSFYTNEVEF